MPDEIDRLVDAETLMEAQVLEENRKPALSDDDRALLDAGSMTKDAARELTNQIKATATATYVLVHRAHELKCWMALGYDSWESYVTSEFDMSKSRSYQLINQAKVVEAIQEVVPDGTEIMLTEAQARDVEKALPKITDKIKNKTAGQSSDEAAKTVQDVVEDERKRQKKEKNNNTGNDGVSLLDGDELDKEAKKRELNPDNNGSTKGGVAPIKDDQMLKSSGDDDMLDDNDDGMDDFDNFDDASSSTLAIGYIFAYADGLSDPVETANIMDDPKKALKETTKTLNWLNKFKDALNKRVNG
jgi:hypothetical protein